MKNLLDLCGGTGAWSAPFKAAGWNVLIIDPLVNDLTTTDALEYFKEYPEYFDVILAAPPCTHFSSSGAQYWKAKDEDGRTAEGLKTVDEVLEIIKLLQPRAWALENPVGRLKKLRYKELGGEPTLIFNPCDYGDPYTKKTLVWGSFNLPIQNRVEPTEGSKMHVIRDWKQRSITPKGFAEAFYAANK